MFKVSTSAYDAANARNDACKTTAFSKQVEEEKEEEKTSTNRFFADFLTKQYIFLPCSNEFHIARQQRC